MVDVGLIHGYMSTRPSILYIKDLIYNGSMILTFKVIYFRDMLFHVTYIANKSTKEKCACEDTYRVAKGNILSPIQWLVLTT